MRVGVLDDESQDQLGRLHRDLQAHRRSPIMEVDEARPDLEVIQEFGYRLTDGRERDLRQRIGLTVARQIGGDDLSGLRQRGNNVPEHPR